VKTYSLVFAPEAEDQLAELYRYIEKEASPEIALHYTSAIIEHCEKLRTFPHRGAPRDDIRPGLRVTNYKGRRLPICKLLIYWRSLPDSNRVTALRGQRFSPGLSRAMLDISTFIGVLSIGVHPFTA